MVQARRSRRARSFGRKVTDRPRVHETRRWRGNHLDFENDNPCLCVEDPLRKSRYTEEQIIFALKEHEAGKTAVQICRKLGVSEQTFYRWKAKFGGMDVADAKRLKGLEEENRKLKQLVGELSLDNQGLR